MNETEILNENFLDFLIKAKTSGYAAGEEKAVKTKEANGSKTIVFSDGIYQYHDNYFGGEPYGGREVVFAQGLAIWMMVYYGKVLKNDLVSTREIYQFLCSALATVPRKAPFRGNGRFSQDDFLYINNWWGKLHDFSGSESIYLKGKRIYEASYIGGLVNSQT